MVTVPFHINNEQYRAFVLGVTDALPIAQTRLLWLGHGRSYADPWVIEAAVQGTPVRLSFKFRQDVALRCCINLRPYAEDFGKRKSGQETIFSQWVHDHYGHNVKAANTAPYFKPFGYSPNSTSRTVDTYFELGSEICLTHLTTVKFCPEFSKIGPDTVVQLTFIEAVSRILTALTLNKLKSQD